MNEKIKELQKAAGIQVVRTLMRGDENTEVKLMLTAAQLDKFAKLIAEDCAQICIDRWVDRVSDDAKECYLEIQKRFGLDES